MNFDSFCVGYKFNSVGSKRSLGTNVSKEAIFLVTKSFVLYFRNIVCGKSQGRIYKGSKSF